MNPQGIGITTLSLAEITPHGGLARESSPKCPSFKLRKNSNLPRSFQFIQTLWFVCNGQKISFIHPTFCVSTDARTMMKRNWSTTTPCWPLSRCAQGVSNTDGRMSFEEFRGIFFSYFLGIYRSESILQYHFLSPISIFLWISLFFWKIDFVLVETVFFINSHVTPLWSNTTHCSGVPGLRQYRFWWDLHPCADIVWISCWKLGSLVRKGAITYF